MTLFSLLFFKLVEQAQAGTCACELHSASGTAAASGQAPNKDNVIFTSVGKEKRRSPSTGDNGKYSGVAMGGTLHCHWPEVSFGNSSQLTPEPV